jgi:osmotically-inducible protein OsmY
MNAQHGLTSVNVKATETKSTETDGVMRTPIATILALAGCAASSGCVTSAIGAAANVGLYAVQDRTIGEGIDDAAASNRVKMRLMAADSRAFSEVDVEVANGALLLSGAVPTEEHRQAAETIARSVATLDVVYNELFVGTRSGFVRSAQDEFITSQIRARFAASSSVRAININIETFRGNVYLMGYARTEDELRRAAEIASVVPGVVRVVSFMQVREARRPYYAEREPTPEYRGDQPPQN